MVTLEEEGDMGITAHIFSLSIIVRVVQTVAHCSFPISTRLTNENLKGVNVGSSVLKSQRSTPLSTTVSKVT